MKYYIPDIRLTTELKQQTHFEDKFGGLPWGLGSDRWPKCSDCGKSLSFLAQFQHHQDRIDLGRMGRALFVFQCNHTPGMCSTWEGGSGANACFVLEPDDMTEGICKQPDDYPLIENEVRVARWLERDDGIPTSDKQSFFDDDSFYALCDDVVEKVTTGTKLGSVPEWIQSPSEAPRGGWEFLGQLDSTHSFIKPPLTTVSWVETDEESWEGRTHYGEGPNYGGGGIAYLFLNKSKPLPEGWFFWQCS